MTKTNDELARQAAERIDSAVDLPLQDLDATVATIAEVIRDTYAEVFPRWIPCSERMPEENRAVLFYCGNRIHYGVWSHYTDGWHSRSSDACYHRSAITHWQPLPQPPEEK